MYYRALLIGTRWIGGVWWLNWQHFAHLPLNSLCGPPLSADALGLLSGEQRSLVLSGLYYYVQDLSGGPPCPLIIL